MGCICAGESDIEHFLTDFIDELKVKTYNDKTFFAYLNRNSPYRSMKTNYDHFLSANQNEDMHANYQNVLSKRSNHLFYTSLIFLIQSDPKKMAANYKQVLQIVKLSHEDTKKETLKELIKDEYDILSDVLNFYVRMISLDVIEAALKSKDTKDKMITEEQFKVLKSNYGLEVIEHFVKDLMKECKNPNVDTEEFFKKNYLKLKHPTVRENLKKWFEKGNTIIKTVKKEENLVSRQKPTNSSITKQVSNERIEQNMNGEKYQYNLPKIDYQGQNAMTTDNYGSNNFEKIKRDMEEEDCVQGGNPGNFEMDNFRIREDAEILKAEQYKIYRKECLYHHNKIRASHGVPPLRESDSLSEYSQQWANFISDTDSLTHSSMIWDGKNVGENIAKAGAVINDPSQLIVQKWYEEKENYDYSSPSSQNNTKNFTQMVWKNTESVGFGLAYSQSGNTFIVINYYPAGNVSDEYRKNVTVAK